MSWQQFSARWTIAVAVLVLGTTAALNGQETPPRASAPLSGAARISNEYIVSPDDELVVSVLDVPEISGSFRVSPGGELTLPLVSQPIAAVGRTLTELSGEIGARLRESGMVSHPRVNIQVKESRLHAIAIGGAVKRPQLYPVLGETTVLDALSQAEGLAEDAGTTAIITRGRLAQMCKGKGVGPAGAANETITVDLNRLLQEGDGSLNLALYPGDSLTVERAGIVYVVGAVNRAGGFVLKDDRQSMTILKALALAENLKTTAVPKKATIIRKSASAGDQEIPVDIAKILSHRAPDRALEPNDILFVPDSTSKRVLHRAGEAAAQAAALFVYRVP